VFKNKHESAHIPGMEGNMNTRVGNMNRVRSYYFKAVKIELFILP